MINLTTAKIGKRGISVLLSVILLISTLSVIPFFSNADNAEKTVFSLLAEATGNKPTQENWSYNIHEFSSMPDFVSSDINFTSPIVNFTDSNSAVVSWNDYSGADGYKLNIYDNSNTLILSQSTTDTSYTLPDGTFTQGGEYQLQVVALSDGKTAAGSMIRPYKYSAPVKFSDVAVNLNGKNMRTNAPETDEIYSRVPAEVGTVAIKNLVLQDSFYYANTSKLPSDTQAIAYWVGQTKSSDGSYYSLNFRHDKLPASMSSGAICYYVPTDGSAVHIGGFQSNGYQSYTDNKHGDFKEGFIVIPLSNFGDSGKQTFLNSAGISIQIPWAQYKNKFAADGTRISNGNLSDSNVNIYCSNIFAISNVEAFINLYLKEQADSSYAAVSDTDFKPDTYNEYGEFYNEAVIDNKFVINTSGKQNVTFTMTDGMSGRKGMQLTFTAPEDGYYDLTHKLNVVNNLSAKGTVYYRVIKKTENVYPTDAEYLEISLNGNNPKANVTPVDVFLKKGEKIVIEAYAKLTEGNSVTVDLGYTTMTYLQSADSSKGFVKTYNAVEYYPSYRMSTTTNAFPYMTADRIEYRMADFSQNLDNPTVIDSQKYNVGWTNNLYYVKPGKILGYYSLIRGGSMAIKMKLWNKIGSHISYKATESGSLTLKMPIDTESHSYNVRVVKNGEQIWPNAGYANINDAVVLAETNVVSGDVVAIQIYSTGDEVIAGYVKPTFTLTKGNNLNSLSNTSYSPLWERPYSDKNNYSGEYVAHPAGMFGFKIKSHTTTDQTKAVANNVNMFDAKRDNYLYYSEANSGFNFTKNSLLFTAGDVTSGAVIDFIAPLAGKYDISMPLKVLEGEGTAEFSIYVNDEKVYPESTSAISGKVSKGDTVDIPALQLNLGAGDTVTLELIAKPMGESMKFDLGTPLFHRFDNTTSNGSETIDVYTPYLFTGFEKGIESERLPSKARFEFLSEDKDGKEEYFTIFDDENKTVANKNDSGFTFGSNGAVTVNIKDTALNHILRFRAPKDISGNIQFSVSSDKAAEMRVLKDGKQIWPESGYYKTTADSENVSIPYSAKKDSVIEWEIKSQNEADVSLAVANITDYYHVNSYSNTDSSYSALSGNPFIEEFEGKYKRYDNELWRFDLSEVKSGTAEIIVPDKYSTKDGNYLYSSKTNTGYRFGDVLKAELKNTDKNYGISLGFISPRADSFTLRTGLEILTENAEASLNVRILHNGKTVWKGDSNTNWYSEKISSGKAIKIPLKLLDLQEGEKVEIQVYAEDITINGEKAEKIEISLVNPDFYSEDIVIKDSTNIKASLLYPHEQFQYYKKAYSGRYTHMENRFNYEFMTYGDEITYFAPDYYDGTKLYSTAVDDSPEYNIASKTVTLTPSVREQKGISLRFTPAMKAEVILMAVPSVTSMDENTVVKFRIMHEDKRLWPKEGLDQNVLSDWEKLDNENLTSLISDRISTEMLESDNIYIELYAETTSETAEPVTVELDVFAATVYRKNTDKIGYSFVHENTDTVQLDPFWSYEYSDSRENIEWKRLSNAAADGYYSMEGVTYNGINYKTGLYGMTKHGKLLSANDMPIHSITFTAPIDGFYMVGKNTIVNYGEYSENFKYRITVNDTNVWPSSGWSVYKGTAAASDTSYKDMNIELHAGDKLRFEVTSESAYNEIKPNARYRAKWLISLTYSQWEKMYHSSDDVYNMLSFDMLDYFKDLAKKQGNKQFDIDYKKHYAESLIPDEEPESNIPDYDDTQIDTDIYDDTEINDGEWVEGTEDQVIHTPGYITKQIKKYKTIVYPVALIVIICVVSVLAVAGIIVIFILHKKGKIHWFKKKSKQ